MKQMTRVHTFVQNIINRHYWIYLQYGDKSLRLQ